MPDLERESPQRNDVLLNEIAAKTGGKLLPRPRRGPGQRRQRGPLVGNCAIKAGPLIILDTPDRLWDNWWMLATVCGLFCTEWLIRRLVKLASRRFRDDHLSGWEQCIMARTNAPAGTARHRAARAAARGFAATSSSRDGCHDGHARARAFWLCLTVDWLFEPSPACAVLLAAGAAATILVFYQLIVRRLAVPLSDAKLALLLERRLGAFDDSLLTAVDLTHPDRELGDLAARMLEQHAVDAGRPTGRARPTRRNISPCTA